MTDLAQLERRVRDLEINRGASFRFAEVVAVDEAKGTARVRLPDGEGLVSMPLRVSQRRTLKDKSQELPDLGEQVGCVFTGQGFEQGMILGAVYSDADASPGRPAHCFYIKFADGTEIEYDRESHRLEAKVKGSADIEADKDVNVSTRTILNLRAGQRINLATPNLSIGGLEGASCETVVAANLNHQGDYKHQGVYQHSGNYNQSGNHNLSGDVNAGGRVIDTGGNTANHSH